jgi:hypothetical protein
MSGRSRSGQSRHSWAQRFSTETTAATKTTELVVYVLAVAGVVVTAFTVEKDTDFGPERAWLYITILTVGYLLSRGLAKAGTPERYEDDYYDDDDYDDSDDDDLDGYEDVEDDGYRDEDRPTKPGRRQRQKQRRRRR